jgi:phasin family protein
MEAPLADKPFDKPIAKPRAPVAAKKTVPAQQIPLATTPAPVAEPKPLPMAPEVVAAKPVPIVAAPATPKPVAAPFVAKKQVLPTPPVKPPVAAVPAPKAPVAVAPPVLSKPVPPVAVSPVPVPPVPVPPVDVPIQNAVPFTAPLSTEGKTTVSEAFTKIEETAKNFAADATTKVKAAVEKGQKSVGEIVEFSKGNFEAVVASGKVAAKGAEEIAKYATDYGRTSIEKANATAKQMSGVKSPTEFFQLQSEIAKTSLEAFVGEASKFGENYMKLLGEIAQPIQNRYALAVDKVKTAVAV